MAGSKTTVDFNHITPEYLESLTPKQVAVLFLLTNMYPTEEAKNKAFHGTATVPDTSPALGILRIELGRFAEGERLYPLISPQPLGSELDKSFYSVRKYQVVAGANPMIQLDFNIPLKARNEVFDEMVSILSSEAGGRKLTRNEALPSDGHFKLDKMVAEENIEYATTMNLQLHIFSMQDLRTAETAIRQAATEVFPDLLPQPSMLRSFSNIFSRFTRSGRNK